MDRRSFVRNMCLGGIATFGFPVVNFAQVKQRGRFVFVLLRGGFDGLAAVVPYGDPCLPRPCAERSRSTSQTSLRSTTRSGWRPVLRLSAISGSATSWP